MKSESLKDPITSQSATSQPSTSLERIGSLLKEARQEKGLSISEIAQGLRIGEEQLIALENGTRELLPELVYIRAMVRRVSERIEIDAKPLISELDGFNRKSSLNSLYSLERSNFNLSSLKDIIPNITPRNYIISGAIIIAISALGLVTFTSKKSNEPTKEGWIPKERTSKKQSIRSINYSEFSLKARKNP